MAEMAMITVGSASGAMAYSAIAGRTVNDFGSMLGIGILGGALYLIAAKSTGLYHFNVLADAAPHVGRIAANCAFVLLCVTAVLFFSKIDFDFSRGATLAFSSLTLILCYFTRLHASSALTRLMDRNAVVGRRVFVLGDPDELSSLDAKYLLRHFGMSEVGRSALPDVSVVGEEQWSISIADALQRARRSRARELALATALDQLETLNQIESALRDSPLPLTLLPNKVLRSVLARTPHPPLVSAHLISLQRTPLSSFEQGVKRALDIAGACFALVALSPVFVVAAIAIKLDSSGPIIFRQRRNGFDQQPFAIFKFRTLHVLEDGPIVVQVSDNDARVTRIGHFLRRSSIDELPQLWNVIRGEMSLVGPRPHALSHDDGYSALIQEYCRRHHVKPGITGWAQVNGLRGEIRQTDDIRKRVDHDLWYINNWSARLDLKILLRTCFAVVRAAAID